LLDRPRHVDLRVVGVVGGTVLHEVWADDIAGAAMTVDVIGAVLRVVFLDENRRGGPNGAVADVVDNAPNGQVVIGLFGLRGGRAGGVVVHDPQLFHRRHRTLRDVIIEVLHPQIDAALVGDAQIEIWEVLDHVVIHSRDRGLCLNRVPIVECRLARRPRKSAIRPSLEALRVGVKLAPARLAGRPVRLQLRIVLDVFAVDLHRQTGGLRFREQAALFLIGKRIAGVPAWIAPDPVRRLDVVGIGAPCLLDPLVTISRLSAWEPDIIMESISLTRSCDGFKYRIVISFLTEPTRPGVKCLVPL
jgi:hypothetical protein